MWEIFNSNVIPRDAGDWWKGRAVSVFYRVSITSAQALSQAVALNDRFAARSSRHIGPFTATWNIHSSWSGSPLWFWEDHCCFQWAFLINFYFEEISKAALLPCTVPPRGLKLRRIHCPSQCIKSKPLQKNYRETLSGMWSSPGCNISPYSTSSCLLTIRIQKEGLTPCYLDEKKKICLQ